MKQAHANLSVSISELKNNPSALLSETNGEAIVLLNHNKLIAYVVPVKTYAKMLELIDDAALLKLSREQLKEKHSAIDVDIHDL